jgi:hypothetical protein
MEDIITSDLGKFGYRELVLAGEMFMYFENHSWPGEFDTDSVELYMNTNSGNVFLSNDEGQTLMMDGDRLRFFGQCSVCQDEKFICDTELEYPVCDDCVAKGAAE